MKLIKIISSLWLTAVTALGSARPAEKRAQHQRRAKRISGFTDEELAKYFQLKTKEAELGKADSVQTNNQGKDKRLVERLQRFDCTQKEIDAYLELNRRLAARDRLQRIGLSQDQVDAYLELNRKLAAETYDEVENNSESKQQSGASKSVDLDYAGGAGVNPDITKPLKNSPPRPPSPRSEELPPPRLARPAPWEGLPLPSAMTHLDYYVDMEKKLREQGYDIEADRARDRIRIFAYCVDIEKKLRK